MRAYMVECPEGEFHEADLPRPVPAAGQVLVRVLASGINPLDTKIRAGKAAHAQQPLPAVLGLDMAGAVEECGPDVTAYRNGDAVFGMIGGVGGLQGTLAEFVIADSRLLAPKPQSLSMRETAALPLATITAWEGIVDRAKAQDGQKVLVHAGAGGVGYIAVQLAKALGAEVFATVSSGRWLWVSRLTGCSGDCGKQRRRRSRPSRGGAARRSRCARRPRDGTRGQRRQVARKGKLRWHVQRQARQRRHVNLRLRNPRS